MEVQEDRRLFKRFSARFPVKFQHSREGFGIDVFLRNASAQGIKLMTNQQMFLYDSVSLLIELPDGLEPMTLAGRVVWIKKKTANSWDVGIEFHKLQLMRMQRMFRLVEHMG